MSPCTNAHLRYQGLGSRNVNVRVEEETTHDSETSHGVGIDLIYRSESSSSDCAISA